MPLTTASNTYEASRRGMQMKIPSSIFLILVAAMLVLPACRLQEENESVSPENGAFGSPQPVTICGYEGDAMEPFITKDGRYLLFNDRNDPRIDTKLQYAERIDDLTFAYRGEIQGVNTSGLEAVPSLDRLNHLFFVSTRSYDETLSTLYRGSFDQGQVSGVELVAGVSLLQLGILTFDAEISADGDTLFIVDGRFTGGNLPETADIDIAVRDGAEFHRLSSARELLRNVNTDELEYAPAVSSDLLELFFTRLYRSGESARTVILRAARRSPEAPFEQPETVTAITGFAEAPTLSNDGRSLYYHKLEGGRYVILRVARNLSRDEAQPAHAADRFASLRSARGG
ncbi:MAG: hypothetical protein FJX72_10865 [Armatimonadetes bacterium]|nr:hypothetical protein [Armatimonadota bacterium]